MIVERARVISASDSALWVEAIQRSSCGVCVAQKGCGQRLLARLSGKAIRLRVLPGERPVSSFQPGETVEIGIPEQVVVGGSLLIYALPLLLLFLGAWFGQLLSGPDDIYQSMNLLDEKAVRNPELYSEILTVGFAFGGLLVGALIVRVLSGFLSSSTRVQPRVLSSEAEGYVRTSSVQVLEK